jgi:hypothetical protein
MMSIDTNILLQQFFGLIPQTISMSAADDPTPLGYATPKGPQEIKWTLGNYEELARIEKEKCRLFAPRPGSRKGPGWGLE